MFWSAVVIVAVLQIYSSTAVIYHLNDTEYARMPPLFGLDEYASCLLPDDGTYCVARFKLHADQDNQLMEMIREYSEANLKHYDHTYIERGICVMKTCKTSIEKEGDETDLGGTLEACLNASVSREYGLQTKLAGVYYCDKHGDKKNIETKDWVVAGIFCAILIAVLIGSIYDIYMSRTALENKGGTFWLSFSIFDNWQWLMSYEPEEPRLMMLKAVHGIRVFIMILMQLPHVMCYNGFISTDNTHDFEKNYDNLIYQIMFSGLNTTQAFFVISGFLLVYRLEIQAEKRQISWGMVAKTWILRWFRLTPAYLMMIVFTATWLRHLGSGPTWNLIITYSIVKDCTRYWWHHLLYIHNYSAPGDACALHSWHMPVEMQLFCMGLFVYLVTKSGRRLISLSILMMIAAVLPAVHVWKTDMNALPLLTPQFFRAFTNKEFFDMHIHGHNNLAGYVIGMMAGYFVYYMQKNKVNYINNKLYTHLIWWILPLILAILYAGTRFFQDGVQLALPVRMFYAAIYRIWISVPIAFLLIACTMGVNHPIRRMLEWPVWVVPSRLSYCIYLIHFNLIFILTALKSNLTVVSSYYFIFIQVGVLGLSFLIAIPFYLMVEAPFNKLARMIAYDTQKDTKKVL